MARCSGTWGVPSSGGRDVIFGSRKWIERQLAELAGELRGARILEIGSGRQDMGEDAYSFRHLFEAATSSSSPTSSPATGTWWST